MGAGGHYAVEHGESGETAATDAELPYDVEQVAGREDDGSMADLYDSQEALQDVGEAAYSAVKDVASWYFEPREWERREDGRLYELAGTHYFKKIVPTFGEYVNRAVDKIPGIDDPGPVRSRESKEEGLYEWLFFTEAAEMGHIALFALSTSSMVGHGIGPEFVAEQLAINIYPVMLQRYNRARIHNHLDEHAPGWRDADGWSDDLLEDG